MTSFQPIIQNLLDTDLYKFTMWQAMLHSHPANRAEYRFHCRNRPAYPLAELKAEVDAQLDHLCSLSFSADDIAFLRERRYLKFDFLDFLSIFRFQRRFIHTRVEGDTLHIEAAGPQVHVMGFEVYVLAIVNELYCRRFDAEAALRTGRAALSQKLQALQAFRADASNRRRHPFEFFDFGTRRRFSRDWHDEVVGTFAREAPDCFKGTSNVWLAKRHGLATIGTMAHEWLQTFQAVPGVQLKYSQKAALEAWVQEYRGDLGIALTDVISMQGFLRDFDLFFTKLFDGMRHDSGDPQQWAEQAIAHYQAMRVDPNTKRLVFSDGLDLLAAFALYRANADRIQTGFGIGTNLSNDVGLQPLSIVMKLVRCSDQPVAKLSDAAGKTMCDDQRFLGYLREVFQLPQPPTDTKPQLRSH